MQAPPGNILIVDDDPLNRRLLAKHLENDGHGTVQFENGFDALAALETEPPDLVLLDVEMPGLDGIEVLERLKDHEGLRHVPVIMISGIEDTAAIVRCIEAGAEDFLPKPFDPAILRARIGSGLNRRRLHDLEQQRVKEVFTRFLPEPIAAELLTATGGRPSIGAVRLWATVMFIDLRGFTTFAESRPVEQVIDVLNRFLGTMADAVLDHGGTLVDYLGDGLMACFGAPIESIDHADRAVAAAREMASERLGGFNDWLRAEGMHDGFRMGIGLNSGRVMSGTLGSDRRIDYTVIGDTVNTASRIEQLTKQTKHSILLADQTRANLTTGADDLVFVDEFEIRGQAVAAQAVDRRSARGADPVTDTELERSQQVQSALYRIAETASAAQDMQAFYAEIHHIVGELMYAENLYIALYDEERQAMNWPFVVDVADDDFPDPSVWEPIGTGDTLGLTALAAEAGHPDVDHSRPSGATWCDRGEVDVVGSPSVSWLGAPLRDDDRTVGAIVVQSYREDVVHTEEDKELLTFVANHIGAALSRARAIEETRQRNAELALINDVQRGLAENLEMQAMYDLVGDRLQGIFDAQVVDIGMLDRETGLSGLPVRDRAWASATGTSNSRSVGFSRLVLETREPLMVNEGVAEQAAAIGSPAIGSGEMAKSVLFVPLVVGGEATGRISLQNLDHEHAFTRRRCRACSRPSRAA